MKKTLNEWNTQSIFVITKLAKIILFVFVDNMDVVSEGKNCPTF
jgi:hypothetical protein